MASCKKGSHTQPSSSQLFSFQEQVKKTIFQEIFIASNTLTRIKKSRRKMHRSLWARMYATFTAKVHNHSPLRRCHLSALINVEKVLLRISYITIQQRPGLRRWNLVMQHTLEEALTLFMIDGKFPLHVYPKYIKGKEKDIKKLEWIKMSSPEIGPPAKQRSRRWVY